MASNTPKRPPTDEEIISFAREKYSPELAAQVQAAIKSDDNFGKHVRRSFAYEMEHYEGEILRIPKVEL